MGEHVWLMVEDWWLLIHDWWLVVSTWCLIFDGCCWIWGLMIEEWWLEVHHWWLFLADWWFMIAGGNLMFDVWGRGLVVWFRKQSYTKQNILLSMQYKSVFCGDLGFLFPFADSSQKTKGLNVSSACASMGCGSSQPTVRPAGGSAPVQATCVAATKADAKHVAVILPGNYSKLMQTNEKYHYHILETWQPEVYWWGKVAD